jgi:hypothetical protein
LLFELGFYYDEREGLGVKFLRYAAFTENEILPRLKQDPRVFYTTDGLRLAPMYEAHMERLRERQKEFDVLNTWARCLDERLSTARTGRFLPASFSLWDGDAWSAVTG